MKLATWLSRILSRTPKTRRVRKAARRSLDRSEQLEDRRVLAVTTVTSVVDQHTFATEDQSMWSSGGESGVSASFSWDALGRKTFDTSIGGFDVGTGAELSLNGHFHAGVAGSVEVGAGAVDVTYPTELKVSASDAIGLRAGEQFRISTTESAGAAFMTTDFADIDTSLSLFADFLVKGNATAKVVDVEIFNEDFSIIDTKGRVEQELIGAAVGDGGVTLRMLGQEIEFGNQFGIELPAPDPIGDLLGATVYVPSLDTDSDDGSIDGSTITNTLLPVERDPATGGAPIDVFEAKMDLDALTTFLTTGKTDGLSLKVQDENGEGFEIIGLDALLQAFFAIGQTMSFDANMAVTLNFNTPTTVEVSPDDWQTVSSHTLAMGDSLRAIHPGGDLIIDPQYSIGGNSFTNVTDFLLQPQFTWGAIGYNFTGDAIRTALDILEINPTATIFGDTYKLTDAPIKLASLFDSSFTVLGFGDDVVSEYDLILPALAAPTLQLDPVSAIDENGVAVLGGTIQDANSGDYFSLDIDWKDGTTETIDFPDPDDANPPDLPDHVTWDPTTGAFTVEHRFLDDGASGSASHTYAVTAEATDSTGETSEQGTADIVVDNVKPTVTLRSIADIDEDRMAHVLGTFSDPGTADTFSVEVDWDDPTNSANSTFTVGTVSSLAIGDTISSSTDGAVLTVNATIESKNEVYFSVSHQYLDDGSAPGNGTPSDVSSVTVSVEDDDTGIGSATQAVTVSNVAPTVSLDTIAGVNEDRGSATLTGRFSDPGTLDRFTLLVDWDDPNAPTDSTFAFGTVSSLAAGQTFSSSTDGAVLTLTDVDLATDTVGFRVRHRYREDGPAPGNGTGSDISTVQVTVTDDDSGAGSATSDVTVRNTKPAIRLDRAIDVNENGVTTLFGRFGDRGVLDSMTVVLDWDDPNNSASSTFAVGPVRTLAAGMAIGSSTDGAVLEITSVDVSAATVYFRVQHRYLDDGPAGGNGTPFDTYTISGTVTDDDSGSDSGTQTVTVTNLAPEFVPGSVVMSATADNKAAVGDVVTLSASFSDVGTLDRHRVRIEWDDGEVSDTQISLADFTLLDDGFGDGQGSFTATHVYDNEGGIFNIRITVLDDDSAMDEASTTAWVTGVRISGGVLQIVGSSADDHVTVTQEASGALKIHTNFLHNGPFREYSDTEAATIDDILSYLCEGDDHVTIAGNIELPVIIHAGAGDDHVKSGRGGSVLLGEAGDDHLIGGKAASILVGGTGSDQLTGGSREDVLIGGSLLQSAQDDSLREARTAWAVEGDSYADRVSTIDSLFTVVDDSQKDKLIGGAGLDLFYDGLDDDLLGVKGTETIL